MPNTGNLDNDNKEKQQHLLKNTLNIWYQERTTSPTYFIPLPPQYCGGKWTFICDAHSTDIEI